MLKINYNINLDKCLKGAYLYQTADLAVLIA